MKSGYIDLIYAKLFRLMFHYFIKVSVHLFTLNSETAADSAISQINKNDVKI